MGFHFYDREFKFYQPDGSELSVKGFGNQYYAVFETLDGFTIINNPTTGYYEYARLSRDKQSLELSGIIAGEPIPPSSGLIPKIRIETSAIRRQVERVKTANITSRWEERLKEAKSSESPSDVLAAPPYRKSVGSYVGLCIPINFPDDRSSIPHSEIINFCNQRGYRGFGNNGSVFDYFYDNSGGKLLYTNVVTPYYTAKKNKGYYTDPTIPYTQRTQELIQEADDRTCYCTE